MTYSPNNSVGMYLPENIDIPKDLEQQLTFFKSRLEEILRELNRKESGSYETIEQLSGKQFPGATPQEKSYVYRKMYTFGVIAAGATLNIPHAISSLTSFISIQGTIITAVPDDRPLPYADEALVTNQVSVKRNGANLVIINGATAPQINSGFLIVEYLK